jgi:hypothetical protein
MFVAFLQQGGEFLVCGDPSVFTAIICRNCWLTPIQVLVVWCPLPFGVYHF